MKLKDFFTKSQNEPEQRSAGSVGVMLGEGLADCFCTGYTPLDQNPEVVAGCRRISELISSMTIYLMSNTDKGDVRIINELSRKLDINPNPYMTRRTFMDAIVMNMLLYGRGNSIVLPHTYSGYLQSLEPVPASNVTFMENGRSYLVNVNGKIYKPENLLHFVHNPDKYYLWKGQGLTTTLQSVAQNLAQAAATEKAFMGSKWKPSLIIKVDALTDEFSSKAGRQKLLDEYINTSEVGEPFIIPAEQFGIEQVKPLSLADLAIADVIQLDKRTVASLLGVPPFVLGIGEYNADAWNAFVNNTVRPIAREIEQELTKKLITSEKWYWAFNIASLYSYDLQKTASVYGDLFTKGIVTGNEVRDKISMAPKDGLDDLILLENYIKLENIADQAKLK